MTMTGGEGDITDVTTTSSTDGASSDGQACKSLSSPHQSHQPPRVAGLKRPRGETGSQAQAQQQQQERKQQQQHAAAKDDPIMLKNAGGSVVVPLFGAAPPITIDELGSHLASIKSGQHLIMMPMTTLIRQLMEHRLNRGGLFNTPVDYVRLKIPSYPVTIKTPMDLGTIKSKLEDGLYTTVHEFATDVRLVFNNAIRFNPPTHVVSAAAKTILADFDTQFANAVSELNTDRSAELKHRCTYCAGKACPLCFSKCLEFQVPVLRCSAPCTNKIARGSTYYRLGGERGQYWCQRCFDLLPVAFVGMAGQQVDKTEVDQRVHDDVYIEPWIECQRCRRWLHQVCCLYDSSAVDAFSRKSGVEAVDFVCPLCVLTEVAELKDNDGNDDAVTEAAAGGGDVDESIDGDEDEEEKKQKKKAKKPRRGMSTIKEEEEKKKEEEEETAECSESASATVERVVEQDKKMNVAVAVDTVAIAAAAARVLHDLNEREPGGGFRAQQAVLPPASRISPRNHRGRSSVVKTKDVTELGASGITVDMDTGQVAAVTDASVTKKKKGRYKAKKRKKKPVPKNKKNQDKDNLKSLFPPPPPPRPITLVCAGLVRPPQVDFEMAIPHCLMSRYIEQRVRTFVMSMPLPTAGISSGHSNRGAGHGLSGRALAESISVRVLSNVDRVTSPGARWSRWARAQELSVGQSLPLSQSPSSSSSSPQPHQLFPHRSKTLAVMQRVDGVHVLGFMFYVQEYGASCPEPNNRTVYLSYLDSVAYIRPRAARTQVYHTVLSAYLEWVQARGFHHMYIWACPPQRGDAYILYCHPKWQRTPSADRLRKWYNAVVDASHEQGVVVSETNMHQLWFPNVRLQMSLRRQPSEASLGSLAKQRQLQQQQQRVRPARAKRNKRGGRGGSQRGWGGGAKGAKGHGAPKGITATKGVKGPGVGRGRGASAQKWNDDEKAEFMRLLPIHGKDWYSISQVIKTKTHSQVKNYYQNYKNKLGLHKIVGTNKLVKSSVPPMLLNSFAGTTSIATPSTVTTMTTTMNTTSSIPISTSSSVFSSTSVSAPTSTLTSAPTPASTSSSTSLPAPMSMPVPTPASTSSPASTAKPVPTENPVSTPTSTSLRASTSIPIPTRTSASTSKTVSTTSALTATPLLPTSKPPTSTSASTSTSTSTGTPPILASIATSVSTTSPTPTHISTSTTKLDDVESAAVETSVCIVDTGSEFHSGSVVGGGGAIAAGGAGSAGSVSADGSSNRIMETPIMISNNSIFNDIGACQLAPVGGGISTSTNVSNSNNTYIYNDGDNSCGQTVNDNTASVNTLTTNGNCKDEKPTMNMMMTEIKKRKKEKEIVKFRLSGLPLFQGDFVPTAIDGILARVHSAGNKKRLQLNGITITADVEEAAIGKWWRHVWGKDTVVKPQPLTNTTTTSAATAVTRREPHTFVNQVPTPLPYLLIGPSVSLAALPAAITAAASSTIAAMKDEEGREAKTPVIMPPTPTPSAVIPTSTSTSMDKLISISTSTSTFASASIETPTSASIETPTSASSSTPASIPTSMLASTFVSQIPIPTSTTASRSTLPATTQSPPAPLAPLVPTSTSVSTPSLVSTSASTSSVVTTSPTATTISLPASKSAAELAAAASETVCAAMTSAALTRDEWLMRSLAAAIYPLRDNLMVLQLNGPREFPEPKRRNTSSNAYTSVSASGSSAAAAAAATSTIAATSTTTCDTRHHGEDDGSDGSDQDSQGSDASSSRQKTGLLAATLANGTQISIKLRLPSSIRVRVRRGSSIKRKKKKRGRQKNKHYPSLSGHTQQQQHAQNGVATATQETPAEVSKKRAGESGDMSSANETASARILETLGVSIASDTADPDPCLPPTIFDTRLTFLDTCQTNNLQFDQLRRAKHTSMVLLGIHVECLSRLG